MRLYMTCNVRLENSLKKLEIESWIAVLGHRFHSNVHSVGERSGIRQSVPYKKEARITIRANV